MYGFAKHSRGMTMISAYEKIAHKTPLQTVGLDRK